jgi:flotillin
VAVKGENQSKIEIANSEANRREKEAEALRIAIAAEKVQQAKALQDAYAAEQKAEDARAERERSTQQANIIIPTEIEKQRRIIEAQAEAEKVRENAKGEADAIFVKMDAEARGLFEILTKQADGYDKMVRAAGGDPSSAYQLLLIEKLPELVKTQVEAIKNIKIDKITVWDGNNGRNEKTSTANFVSGLMKSVPPLNDLFNMAGLDLPKYLKENKKDSFYEELLKAVWGYLSDKLNIPVSSLTKDNAAAELTQYGAKAELIEQFRHILDRAEFAQYAPSEGQGAMDELYQETIEAINNMEKL